MLSKVMLCPPDVWNGILNSVVYIPGITKAHACMVQRFFGFENENFQSNHFFIFIFSVSVVKTLIVVHVRTASARVNQFSQSMFEI